LLENNQLCSNAKAGNSQRGKFYYKKIQLFLNMLLSFSDFAKVAPEEQAAIFEVFVKLLRKDNEQVQLLALDCIAKFQKEEI